MNRRTRVLRLAASIGVIAATTALYVWLVSVNPTTVALTYLVTILVIATQWGITEATTASVLATLRSTSSFSRRLAR